MEYSTGKFNCFSRTHCQNSTMCNDGGGCLLDFYAFYRGVEGLDEKSRRKTANREIYNTLFRKQAPSQSVPSPAPVIIQKLDTTLSQTLAPEELSAAYADFLAMLDLSASHRRSLRARGLTDESIDANGYKTFPQVGMRNIPALLTTKHKLIGVPGFYEDKEGVVTLAAYDSSFMIPYTTPNGHVAGIQLRLDNKVEVGEKSDGSKKFLRYLWLSSSSKDKGAQVNTEFCAGYSGFDFKNPPKRVGLTEGKLKGDVANSLLRQMGKEVPMCSIPGISMRTIFRNMIEYLLSIGVEEFIDYFDMDRYENEYVMRDIGKLYDIMAEYGIRPIFKPWNRSFKGIDDFAHQVLRMNGGGEVSKY